MGKRHPKSAPSIRFLQLNANRRNVTLRTLLQTADEKFDILFVQEPRWGELAAGKWGEPTHPSWRTILPTYPILEEMRPRVLAYVSNRRSDLEVTLRSDIVNDLDMQLLEVRQGKNPPTFFLNIYNEKDVDGIWTSQRLRKVRLPLSAALVLTGDWNLHHPWWEPGHVEHTRQEDNDTADWLSGLNFTLMNDTDVLTFHSHAGLASSTIDLTFINETADARDTIREWTVDDDMAFGSDHSALRWIVDHHTSPVPDPDRCTWNYKNADVETFSETLRESLDARRTVFDPLRTTPTPAEIDIAAEAMEQCLVEALDSSCKRRRLSPRSVPWWSDDLRKLLDVAATAKKASREHTNRTRSPDPLLVKSLKEAEKAYTTAFNEAKSTFYKAELVNANHRNVFQFRKWTQGRREYPSPPINRAGRDPEIHHPEKCAALREELFPKPADLPHQSYPDLDAPRDELPFSKVTRAEVRDAIFSADPHKAPGPDGIPTQILRWAWEVAEDELFLLLAQCTQVGHHPKLWHRSIAIALRKPNKKDYSNPRSYRLIQLLNTLGKAAEKLIATRLTWMATTSSLIPQSQFGAMPGKSTVDAILTFTHDVQAAWDHGMATSALTFDITGAFDFVSHPALLSILAVKGIPSPIIRWVRSFLSERETAICLDGKLEDMAPVQTGIPQGSPVSPILFLFASSGLEEYVRAGFPSTPGTPQRDHATTPSLVFFVDDGKIYVSSFSLETNTRFLKTAYSRAQEFLAGQGMRIDQVKRELMHYPGPRHIFRDKPKPSIKLPGPRPGDPETEIEPGKTVRWLGVHLDPRLSFGPHVAAMKAKADAALGCLRRLSNTRGGLHQTMCRQLYISCVLPILTYASQVWFKGEGVTGSIQHAAALQLAQNEGMKFIGGFFRTTPIVARHIECALLPMAKKLEQINSRYAIRLRSLDNRHPILQRLDSCWRDDNDLTQPTPPLPPRDPIKAARKDKQNTTTQLHKLAGLCLPEVERVHPFDFPPWRRSASDPDLQGRLTIRTAASAPDKPRAAKRHLRHISKFRNDPTHFLVYTDGSLLEIDDARRAGLGIAVYCQDTTVMERSVGLGGKAEVYDAEVLALETAAEWVVPFALATRDDAIPTVKHLHFYADNDSAITLLDNLSPGAGIEPAARCWHFILQFLDADPSHTVEISWIPGHHDIPGNERADILAKRGTRNTDRTVHSITHARRAIDEKIWERVRDAWEANRRSRGPYRLANHFPPTSRPSRHFRELPRRIYSIVNQCRTGHAFLGEYYQHHVPSEDYDCSCGAGLETRQHVLTDCWRYTDERNKFLKPVSPTLDVETILGTEDGIRALAEFIEATGAFSKMGPTEWKASLKMDKRLSGE